MMLKCETSTEASQCWCLPAVSFSVTLWGALKLLSNRFACFLFSVFLFHSFISYSLSLSTRALHTAVCVLSACLGPSPFSRTEQAQPHVAPGAGVTSAAFTSLSFGCRTNSSKMAQVTVRMVTQLLLGLFWVLFPLAVLPFCGIEVFFKRTVPLAITSISQGTRGLGLGGWGSDLFLLPPISQPEAGPLSLPTL